MSKPTINVNSFEFQKTDNRIKWRKLSLKEKEDKMKQYEKEEQNMQDWRDQQACSYAALICFDVGVDINEENINKLLEGAKLKVKKYWPELFCKLVKSKGLTELIASSVNTFIPNKIVRDQSQATDAANEKKTPKKEEKDSVAQESSASAVAFFDKTDSDDDSDSDSS